MSILTPVINLIFGTKQQRDMRRIQPVVNKINALEPEISKLNNEELSRMTIKFKERLAKGETLDDILVEAFATCREVAKRTLNMRHFDVQLIGGYVLHNHAIAEMKTGEGKTLVATLPLYLNALTGKGCHLVTVNDYLAKRDALWMGPIYKFLGLTVGVINHEKSYRIEWDDISKWSVRAIECSRKEAYSADITYGTNNEFGFDYLRDNMVFSLDQKVQRKHYYAIVDEVDSILIDEARTPLIISGPTEEATDLYYKIDKIIPRLTQAQVNEKNEPIEGTGDYAIDEKDKTAVLTEQGIEKVEKLLNIKDLYSPKNSHIVHHVIQGIRAHKLFHIDVDYVVENGEVIIVDEFTGRKMPGRRWSDGLHQAIEAKERVNIRQEFQTLATITFQNYFRMYEKLAGMTGTAETEAQEFYAIYKLDVVTIPTNLPVIRKDYPDKIYINENAKYKAIVRDVIEYYKKGQPVLLGTISVEKSEKLSKLLKQHHIPHNVLNAKYHEKEAEIIQKAGQKYAVTIATNMAGRGTDIKLGEGVKELGGLCVIGSERHEARRIDNQLRGRSGRQGDPGISQFYVSLEDDLMRLFGMDSKMKLMASLGFTEDEEIQSKMISNAIEKAQKRVENRNFEIRKHLLEYDNVMNEQRTYIYNLRDKILDFGNNITVIDELCEIAIKDAIKNFQGNENNPLSWNKDSVNKWLYFNFGIELKENLKPKLNDTINLLKDLIKSRTWNKFSNIPNEIKIEALKFIALTTLDNKWKQHLRNIDILKEGIGLMGYAQKNPLVEYKIQSFRMFNEMRYNFVLETLSLMSKVNITANIDFSEDYNEYKNINATHNEYGQFGTLKSTQEKPALTKNQPLKKIEKPGVNDPCWCGSGKKYKKCHLEEDRAKELRGIR